MPRVATAKVAIRTGCWSLRVIRPEHTFPYQIIV